MATLFGWVALAAGALLGWLGRFFVIEPERVQAICTAAAAPAWCEARAALLAATFPPRYGIVAVAAALACWALRRRPAAVAAALALFAAGLGLFLYDTGWAASGALIALLRLPRIGEEPADPREFSA